MKFLCFFFQLGEFFRPGGCEISLIIIDASPLKITSSFAFGV